MSQPVKKIDTLRQLMLQNDWQKALSLAAKFPRLGAEKAVIVRGHECLINPAFYKQLGIDTDKAVNDAITALKTKYNQSSLSGK